MPNKKSKESNKKETEQPLGGTNDSIDLVKNHGVLLRPLAPTDYRLGATAIPFEQRVPDANWTKWLPEDEKQSTPGVMETMACVSFSACNCIETQLNWLYDMKKIPQAAVNFLMDNGYYKNGKFNVSDRFIAILSGTTAEGNYLDKVDYTIRKVGLIPESMLPYGGSNQTEYLNPAMVTKKMTDLGLEFLKYFYIQYEATFYPGLLQTTTLEIKKLYREQLQHAPLHIATATCSPWHTKEVIKACNEQVCHATELSGLVWEQYFIDYDTYDPFQKKLAWDYNIPFAWKIIINPIIGDPVAVQKAQKKVKDTMSGRIAPYFQRVEHLGEVYEVNLDGSFKYLFGVKCPLFDSLSRRTIFTPFRESLWREVELAEIK